LLDLPNKKFEEVIEVSQSNFERLVGEALSNEEFAEKLKNATEKIKNGDRTTGEQEFRAALEWKFGPEGPKEDEIARIIEAIQTIDIEAIYRVAKAFGADNQAN
jgi:hypothetical protein